MRGEDILRIPDANPEILFVSPGEARAIFLKLSLQWHPDKNSDPQSSRVFAHISHLYDEAKKKISSNSWSIPGVLEMTNIKNKKTVKIKFKRRHKFDIGEIFYSENSLFHLIDNDYADIFHSSGRVFESIKYPDTKIQDQMKNLMPQTMPFNYLETTRSQILSGFHKPEGSFLLRDIREFYKGRGIPVEHIAWITTRLFDLCAFLEWQDICHNSFDDLSLYVNIENHYVSLLGGWWYSCHEGQKIVALPSAIRAMCPRDILTSKISNTRLDRMAVRNLVLSLLRENTDKSSKAIREKMILHLRLPPLKSSQEERDVWLKNKLPEIFGARRFAKWSLTSSDIFGE